MRQMFVAISLLVSVGLLYGQEDIEVNPQFYDFGALAVEESATVTVTIFNVGDKSIAINDISFTEDSSGDYLTLPILLPLFFSAGGSFDFEVTFTPSKAGLSGATLQISSSDPDEPIVEVVLVGEGIGGEMTPEDQIQAIIEFAQVSIDNHTLVGKGTGKSATNRLKAFANMLSSAEKLISDDLVDAACSQLDSIYKHVDGESKPGDFVEGEAVSELGEMVLLLMESLACDE